MIRIKELRTEKRIKQVDLAKQLGIAQNTLSYWERGESQPDNKMLEKIAEFFGVSIDYLLGRSDIRCSEDIDGLPPEAIEHLERYKKFLIKEYGKKET